MAAALCTVLSPGGSGSNAERATATAFMWRLLITSDAVDLVRVNESQRFCSTFWKGSAKRYAYNCRHLPFENANRDVVIVQAGLHHLPRLPEDLEMTLAEMRRVLRPGAEISFRWETGRAAEVKRQNGCRSHNAVPTV